MTQPELIKGLAILAIIMAAAWLSMPYADRYVVSVAPVKVGVPDSQAKTPAESVETAEPPSAVCVQADGCYKNWPFPNVPTLSPRCAPEK